MRTQVGRFLLLALVLSVWGVLPAAGQRAPDQTGRIAGQVTSTETGAPVVGAAVQVINHVGETLVGALTDQAGRYRLENVAPGSYTLLFGTQGFEPRRIENVSVTAGQTTTINADLAARAIQLNPVQVSVGRRQEKVLDAPARVEVVGTREIEDRPALTVIDHVRGMPGVDAQSSGLIQSNVVTRGFNNVFSTALMMITDHRHASVPSLRVNAPYMMPISDDDIERIEVVVGPAAALYGPSSASGVLHAITKSPFTSPGTRVSLAGGERSVLQGGLRHAGVIGERVGYRISGQYFGGNDWEHVDPAEPLVDPQDPARPARVRDSQIQIMKGDGRLDLRLTGNTSLVLSSGINNVGSAIELTPLGAAQAQDWRYTYFQARLNHNRFFVQTFINTSDAGETFLLRTQQPVIDRSRLFVGQLQHGLDFGEAPGQPGLPLQSFTYGIDYQHTQPRTEGTILGRNEGVTITEIGGYLQSETRLIPLVDLVLAGRLDRHSHFGDPVFSPRAALVFKPAEGQNVRVSYNRAFDNPIPNNLFLDIVAGQAGPYSVRAMGIPAGGFQYNRQCGPLGGVGGYCMRSPFAPTAGQEGWLPADATLMWDVVVGAMLQQGIDLQLIPRPTSATVGTVLRTLDPTAGVFRNVDPAAITDIVELRPTITNAFEVGYKGLIGDRVLLAADLWHKRKNDFTGPLMVETPNVFFDVATLTAHLAPFVGDQQAAQLAAGIAGLPGSTEATGIPLGVVTFAQADWAGPQDVILTYRNFGEVELWGTDLSAQVLVTDELAVTAAYSHMSQNFFTPEEVGGPAPVALNAPRNKGSLGVQYRNDPLGLTTMLRGRFVEGFPMNSGVYIGEIPSYSVLDATIAYRVPQVPGLQLSLSAQNLLNERHRQWIGAPQLGRLVLTKLQYEF